MMRRIGLGSAMLAVLAGLTLPVSDASQIRVDNETGVWTVVPNSILQQLPSGLGLPPELKIGVLGANPVTIDLLSGPTAPSTVRAGFTIVNGIAVPAGVAVAPSKTSPAFDAQGPLWLPPPMPVLCPTYPLLSFYACPTNLVAGLKIEWGVPAFQQVVFLNLGSPAGIQLYDSYDYTCTPQGFDTILGTACQYHNVGTAFDGPLLDPFEFEFNCTPSQPAAGGLPAVPGGCPNGAALQWRGMLYTASADILDTPSSTSPNQGPPLNEFVFNAGKLYAPPGWQSFFVTFSQLTGPSCEFVAGAPLTFYAHVGAYLDVIPSGTVTLLDGTTTLATATLGILGNAKFTTSLGSGSHSLSVAYQGNSKYAPSRSAADILVSQDLSPNCE
jgi:Bacterial Ig-like domain (group 3)